jgi:hypothetical protein
MLPPSWQAPVHEHGRAGRHRTAKDPTPRTHRALPLQHPRASRSSPRHLHSSHKKHCHNIARQPSLRGSADRVDAAYRPRPLPPEARPSSLTPRLSSKTDHHLSPIYIRGKVSAQPLLAPIEPQLRPEIFNARHPSDSSKRSKAPLRPHPPRPLRRTMAARLLRSRSSRRSSPTHLLPSPWSSQVLPASPRQQLLKRPNPLADLRTLPLQPNHSRDTAQQPMR